MKQRIYIETSIISYLAGKPSRDIIVAGYQQITHDWWDNRASQFDLFSSELVFQESKSGDSITAKKRLSYIEDIPFLELNTEAVNLAQIILKKKVLPKKAGDDSLHIAIATIYGLDYLLTWNCKHIANAEIQKNITRICFEEGYEMPTISTPLELMGG